MTTTKLYQKVKQRTTVNDNFNTVLGYDDERELITIPITCAFDCKAISFHLKYNYSIQFEKLVILNFVEDERLTEDEVIGDIEDILSALTAGVVLLMECTLLNHRAYFIKGLNPRRFVQVNSIIDTLTLKFGKVVRTSEVKLKP